MSDTYITPKNGRDPLFQLRSILLLKQSCRTALRRVRNPKKEENLKEGMEVFDKWLENYRKTKMSKQNNLYIPLHTLEGFMPLLKHYDIDNVFLDIYFNECKGDYKRLRQIKGENNDNTWDIVRNTAIKELKEQSEENEERLWTEDMIPSKIHAKMISWAYSPHKELRLRPQQVLFEKINNIISK
ncbi:uncharacterized protein LOC123305493 isoform X2 [Chrysoperla carnea]|uniref:uncharacterized protein LOC123305493 isoform X2 n=1 Tax=Chrysoperla carnea TaxID=189513 RepID=UPI001D096524|nr:uncharacterized protein LOC123305493 isoform X2 [Chrysoperla carnea]